MLLKWTYKKLKKTRNGWHISYRIYLKGRVFYYDFRFQKVKDVSFNAVELSFLINILNRLRVFVDDFDSEPFFFRRVWKYKKSIYYTNEPIEYYITHNKIKKNKLIYSNVKKNIDMNLLGINKQKSLFVVIIIIIFERIKCFLRGSDCSNKDNK